MLAELRQQRDDLLTRTLPVALRTELADTNRLLIELGEELAKLPTPKLVYAGMVYSGGAPFTGTGPFGGKPREIRVLARGDVRNPGKLVGPGTVPFSSSESGDFALAEGHSEGERRVTLAKWITAKDNPLTWRSIVNRVWQYHFGRGIVDSPNDFGRMGQLPSHPELLDWLAVEFRDGGQSFKQLHRLIVTSATYRQSSTGKTAASPLVGEDYKLGLARYEAAQAVDSGNVFLWRMNRRKLEAEAIRDAVLVVAGKLDRRLGGPAFQDFVVEKPEHSPHYEYQLHDPEDERTHRRSIYRFLVRSQPQPFMSALDCADSSMSVDKRNETVTSLQALALLNNQLMLTMEQHMAGRVAKEKKELAVQVDYAFRLALSRSPTEEEHQELTKYASVHGLTNVCRVLINLNEFMFVD